MFQATFAFKVHQKETGGRTEEEGHNLGHSAAQQIQTQRPGADGERH